LRSAYWLLAQPLRLRALLAAGALVAYVHPKFNFKKHGNGIHPPTCFLFKCVSKVRSVNTMASLLSAVGFRGNRLKLLRFLALSLFD
jgi:hypothetical protein